MRSSNGRTYFDCLFWGIAGTNCNLPLHGRLQLVPVIVHEIRTSGITKLRSWTHGMSQGWKCYLLVQAVAFPMLRMELTEDEMLNDIDHESDNILPEKIDSSDNDKTEWLAISWCEKQLTEGAFSNFFIVLPMTITLNDFNLPRFTLYISSVFFHIN